MATLSQLSHHRQRVLKDQSGLSGNQSPYGGGHHTGSSAPTVPQHRSSILGSDGLTIATSSSMSAGPERKASSFGIALANARTESPVIVVGVGGGGNHGNIVRQSLPAISLPGLPLNGGNNNNYNNTIANSSEHALRLRIRELEREVDKLRIHVTQAEDSIRSYRGFLSSRSDTPTSLSNKRDMSMQTDSGMGASESDVQRLQELENKFVLQEKARHSLLNTISSLNDEIARYQQEISVLKDKENKSKDKLNINVTVTNNNNKKEKEKADSAEHILLAKEYEKTIVDLKLQMERYEKERAAKASKQVATPSPKKLKSSSSRKELFANLALECKDLIGEERTRLRQDSTQIQMQLAQYQHEMAATVSKLLERLRQSEEKWRNKLAQVTNTNSADAQAHANQMHALAEECEGLRRTVTRLESEINAAQQVNNFVASKRTPTKEAIQSPAHHIKPKTPSSTGRPSNNNNELLLQQQKELQQQLQQHQQQVLLLQQQLQQLQQQHNHTIAQLQQTINQQQFQIHSQRTEMEHSIEYFKRSAVEKQALVDVRDDTIGNMRINIQLLGEQLEMVPDKHALELKCTQHHAHVKDLGRVAAIRELTIERDSLFDELKRAK
jgi:chromosome segregation ATPase